MKFAVRACQSLPLFLMDAFSIFFFFSPFGSVSRVCFCLFPGSGGEDHPGVVVAEGSHPTLQALRPHVSVLLTSAADSIRASLITSEGNL